MAWVFNYADCAGNSHNWTYTYTIDMPDFTPAADAASTVSCPALAVQPATPTVIDACGNPIIPTGPVIVQIPNPVINSGTIIYTWTFTDCAGTSANWSYTYTILGYITPTFAPIGPLCQNTTAPALPAASIEGITGTWARLLLTLPSLVLLLIHLPRITQLSAAYPAPLIINVTTEVTPTFAPIGPLCQNTTAPALPAASIEGITGTWAPAAINTAVAGPATYTFTPDNPAQCGVSGSFDY